jgi:hypothetical protein
MSGHALVVPNVTSASSPAPKIPKGWGNDTGLTSLREEFREYCFAGRPIVVLAALRAMRAGPKVIRQCHHRLRVGFDFRRKACRWWGISLQGPAWAPPWGGHKARGGEPFPNPPSRGHARIVGALRAGRRTQRIDAEACPHPVAIAAPSPRTSVRHRHVRPGHPNRSVPAPRHPSVPATENYVNCR